MVSSERGVGWGGGATRSEVFGETGVVGGGGAVTGGWDGGRGEVLGGRVKGRGKFRLIRTPRLAEHGQLTRNTSKMRCSYSDSSYATEWMHKIMNSFGWTLGRQGRKIMMPMKMESVRKNNNKCNIRDILDLHLPLLKCVFTLSKKL